MTYYSSFFSGTLTVFFGYTAYLIPLFFLFIGLKKILNFKTHFFFIHLLVFSLGIASLGLFFSALGFNGGVVGSFELKYLNIEYANYLQNNLYLNIFLIILFIFSIFTIFYGLTLKNKVIFKILGFAIRVFPLSFRKITFDTQIYERDKKEIK